MSNADRWADIRLIVGATILGGVIGFAYTFVVYLSAPDAEGSIWSGILAGGMIAALSSSFEILFVSKPSSVIRQMPFIKALLVREAVHFIIIIGSLLAVQYVFHLIYGHPVFLLEQNLGNSFTDIVFSFVIMTLVISMFQIRLFIGERNLKNLLLGKYNQPQIEERVFLIVDVVGATSAAEKIGDERFHRFLNELFILFDDPIHRFGGEVHSYVGDAIIAIWPLDKEKQNNSKVFEALSAIERVCVEKGDVLTSKFGIVPRVHAAIHAGPVAMGEMGFRKRQITYLGSALNLTFRLEGLSKLPDVKGGMLVSDYFLERTEVPENIRLTTIGERTLKGASEKLLVSSIEFLPDKSLA